MRVKGMKSKSSSKMIIVRGRIVCNLRDDAMGTL